ncbi:MAG TPA: SdiA-regulated domain-containing protein [Oxalicibacterium sp.]|nr:SdiA-regulated domain-containing protein [Oxalicibacterium sp.]
MKHVKPSYSLGFFLPHALRWLVTGSLLVVLGIAVYIGIRFYHVDNQLYLWWRDMRPSQTASAPQTGSLPLQAYRMDIDGRVIDGIDRNLSGLAFNHEAKQLIAVVNRPATLLTMDLEGHVLHRHRLRHASDVEGVAYLGNNRIALSEEGDSRILVTTLPAKADAELDLRDATSFALDMGSERDNAGFEGLGYDHRHDWLYIGKEHSPRGLYRISGLGENLRTGRVAIRVENLSHWLDDKRIGTDLASVDVNEANGHLLLLSEESQRIVELDTAGKVANQLELRALANEGMPQPEGVALGPDGTLYLISEPNLFYRLKPPQ